MASVTPDLRLPSRLTPVPNLYCLVPVGFPGY